MLSFGDVFREIDLDKDGKISKPEFQKALTGKRKVHMPLKPLTRIQDRFRPIFESHKVDWKAVFAAIDSDRDGRVSQMEFESVVQGCHQGCGVPRQASSYIGARFALDSGTGASRGYIHLQDDRHFTAKSGCAVKEQYAVARADRGTYSLCSSSTRDLKLTVRIESSTGSSWLAGVTEKNVGLAVPDEFQSIELDVVDENGRLTVRGYPFVYDASSKYFVPSNRAYVDTRASRAACQELVEALISDPGLDEVDAMVDEAKAAEEWDSLEFESAVDLGTFVGAMEDMGLSTNEAKLLFEQMNGSRAGALDKREFMKRFSKYEAVLYADVLEVVQDPTTLLGTAITKTH